MKRIIIITLAIGILSATSAFAQSSPFSYNYIQAGYSSGNINLPGLSLKTTGAALGASVTTSDTTFITGSFGSGTVKYEGLSANLDNWSIGFGGRMPISSATDLVGVISYLSTTLSDNIGWVKSTGFGFDVGLRHALGEKVELGAGVGLSITGSDRIQTTSASVGAKYKISNGFSIGINYAGAKNDVATSNGVGINGRIDF